jgi:hypothetical protein
MASRSRIKKLGYHFQNIDRNRLFEKEWFFDNLLITDIYITIRELLIWSYMLEKKVLSFNWNIDFGGNKKYPIIGKNDC